MEGFEEGRIGGFIGLLRHNFISLIGSVENHVNKPGTERWIISILLIEFHTIRHKRLHGPIGGIFTFFFFLVASSTW
jgi:hypothetical protein